jgi:hypothetical protein
MTQLDLFYEDPPRRQVLKASTLTLTLGDLIDLNGEVYEIDSVLRFSNGRREYTYRPYEGPL